MRLKPACMRGLGRGVIAGLGVVALSAATAGSALGRRLLPKGTPYAAEVTASIIGTADISYANDDTTSMVCESQPSEDKVSAHYSLDWVASYPHVTVPVADDRELGAAYKRLHVKAQPTSNGHGGLMAGNYDISGMGPPTQVGGQTAGGTDCTQVPYGGQGKFHSLGPPDYLRQRVRDFFGDTQPVYFFTMPPLFARPDTYRDSLGDTINVMDAFATAYGHVPFSSAAVLKTQPTWDSIPADFSIDELKKLVHSSTLKLKSDVYSGKADCSTGSNSVVSNVCSVSWTFRWTVTLHRKFLYRTKFAYRK